MHDGVGMAEGHPFQQHEQVAFHLGIRERLLGVADHLRQVRYHVLKDQHKPCAMREDVLQFHHLERQEEAAA